MEAAEKKEKERKKEKASKVKEKDNGGRQEFKGEVDGMGPCSPWDARMPARGETPLLMLDRWRKLHDELYDRATGFDISKV